MPPTKRTNPNKGTNRTPPPPQCWFDAPLGPGSHGQLSHLKAVVPSGFNGVSSYHFKHGSNESQKTRPAGSAVVVVVVVVGGNPKSTKQNGTKNSWMNPKGTKSETSDPPWTCLRTPCLCKINGDEGKTQGPRVLSCFGLKKPTHTVLLSSEAAQSEGVHPSVIISMDGEDL